MNSMNSVVLFRSPFSTVELHVLAALPICQQVNIDREILSGNIELAAQSLE